MRATAQAQPNIALVKYWGKRDSDRNLPAVGSVSLTLEALWTRMTVDFDTPAAGDSLYVNGAPAADMLPRVARCLDVIAGTGRPPATVTSECNFPIAAGLASSAAAFAALVTAAGAACERPLETLSAARIAGRASGSAARSLYPGIVELHAGDADIDIDCLVAPADWPLLVTVAVTATAAKAVGSGRAMDLSRESSPFYAAWVERQHEDLTTARAAIAARDFRALAAVAEHNCLKMHSVMWTSRPALVYWNSATLACLTTVRDLQQRGVQAFFTIDAGPQVKVVSTVEAAAVVADAMRATDGVVAVMQSGLGSGARLMDAA